MVTRRRILALLTGCWMAVSASAVLATEHVYYFHNDHLGTPQAMSDAEGRTVWTAEYDPFGKATVNQDPDGDGQIVVNNLRFPGQYYDAETGLHYNWNRYYDPNLGRYLTPDPIGLSGGMNLYGYTGGNPINQIDPFGLDFNVCLYRKMAVGRGHIGYGFPDEQTTMGFYPTGNPRRSPGEIKKDPTDGKECKTVESSPTEDKCMKECRERWETTSVEYRIEDQQCTTFVRECMKECNLAPVPYEGPSPKQFYYYLNRFPVQ